MEIRVLHFIPYAPTDEEQASLMDLFLRKMAERSSTHVASMHSLGDDTVPYTTHCLAKGKAGNGSKGMLCVPGLHKRFLQLLYTVMPHVVHVHGSYQYINSRIEKWSLERGFPVVFSPLGGMNPAFIDKEYGMRTWKLIRYQKAMVRHADCVLTTDNEEAEYITTLRLTDRICLLNDPRSGEFVDLDAFADSVLGVYAKVLDSDKGLHIDQRCREAVSALLHISLADEKERSPLCPDDILNLRSLNLRQWRDIMLFAREQGVVPYVVDGMAKAQLPPVDTNLAQADHFEPRHPKDTEQLSGQHLLTKNWWVKHRLSRVKSSDPGIRSVIIMLFNIQYLLRRHALTLSHLCDLYSIYRHIELDEDQLAADLRSVGLTSFARRISQLMCESAYLDEGFMPMPALDDGGTARLRAMMMTY